MRSTAYGYCVGLITPAELAGDCVEPMSRAQYPRQCGGVLPGFPGAFAPGGIRGVFTAHGTKTTYLEANIVTPNIV